MTVKELKEIINNIDKKYDNEEVITNDKNYTEYCMGSPYIGVTGVEQWLSLDRGYYLLLETRKIINNFLY